MEKLSKKEVLKILHVETGMPKDFCESVIYHEDLRDPKHPGWKTLF